MINLEPGKKNRPPFLGDYYPSSPSTLPPFHLCRRFMVKVLFIYLPLTGTRTQSKHPHREVVITHWPRQSELASTFNSGNLFGAVVYLCDQPVRPAYLACYNQTALQTSGLFIRPDGTYVEMVHMLGQYMILVYCTATVIAQISVWQSPLFIITIPLPLPRSFSPLNLYQGLVKALKYRWTCIGLQN